MGLVLAIILVFILLGGIGPWPGNWYGAPADHGPYYGGGIGFILLILLILLLVGRI